MYARDGNTELDELERTLDTILAGLQEKQEQIDAHQNNASLPEKIKIANGVWTLNKLVQIIEAAEEEKISKEKIHADLQEFLSERWDTIKGTYLSYTSIPTADVTKACYAVANYLAKNSNNELTPLSLLMPTIKHFVDVIYSENINTLPIDHISQLHISSDDNESLIPIGLLISIELESDLSKILTNPYLGNGKQSLTDNEIRRLIKHSIHTEGLIDSKERYLKEVAAGSSLYEAFQKLIVGLRQGGAHGLQGGVEGNAGIFAYTARADFRAYWKLLPSSEKAKVMDWKKLPASETEKIREKKKFRKFMEKKILNIKLKDVCVEADLATPLEFYNRENRDLFLGVELGEEKKVEMIKQFKNQFEEAKEHITKILDTRDNLEFTYSGKDNLFLSTSQIESYVNKDDINNSSDVLLVIRNLQPEEIKRIVELYENIGSAVRNGYDLVVILVDLNKKQIEAFVYGLRKSIKDNISINDIANILNMLTDPTATGFIRGYKDVLDLYSLSSLFVNLSTQKKKVFLDVYNTNELINITDKRRDVEIILSSVLLTEDARKIEYLEALKGKLKELTISFSDVKYFVELLLPDSHDSYVSQIIDKLNEESFFNVNDILYLKSDAEMFFKNISNQNKEVFLKIYNIDKLINITKSRGDFEVISSMLSEDNAKKAEYIREIQSKLKDITHSIPDVIYFLKTLPSGNHDNYINQVNGKLKKEGFLTVDDIINLKNNFDDLFKNVSEQNKKYFLEILYSVEELVRITKKRDDVEKVLSSIFSINDTRQAEYLKGIQRKLKDITQSMVDVIYFLKILPSDMYNDYISQIKDKLKEINFFIFYHIINLFENISEQNKKAFLVLYSTDELIRITETRYNVMGIMSSILSIDSARKQEYLKALQSKLNDITNSVKDVQYFLTILPGDSHGDYINQIKNKLKKSDFLTVNDIQYVFSGLSNQGKIAFLEIYNTDELINMTKTGSDAKIILSSILSIDNVRKDEYLEALQSKLRDFTNSIEDVRHFLNILQADSHNDYINQIKDKLKTQDFLIVSDIGDLFKDISDQNKKVFLEIYDTDELIKITKNGRNAQIIMSSILSTDNARKAEYLEELKRKLVELTNSVDDVVYFLKTLPSDDCDNYISQIKDKLKEKDFLKIEDVIDLKYNFESLFENVSDRNKKIFLEIYSINFLINATKTIHDIDIIFIFILSTEDEKSEYLKKIESKFNDMTKSAHDIEYFLEKLPTDRHDNYINQIDENILRAEFFYNNDINHRQVSSLPESAQPKLLFRLYYILCKDGLENRKNSQRRTNTIKLSSCTTTPANLIQSLELFESYKSGQKYSLEETYYFSDFNFSYKQVPFILGQITTVADLKRLFYLLRLSDDKESYFGAVNANFLSAVTTNLDVCKEIMEIFSSYFKYYLRILIQHGKLTSFDFYEFNKLLPKNFDLVRYLAVYTKSKEEILNNLLFLPTEDKQYEYLDILRISVGIGKKGFTPASVFVMLTLVDSNIDSLPDKLSINESVISNFNLMLEAMPKKFKKEYCDMILNNLSKITQDDTAKVDEFLNIVKDRVSHNDKDKMNVETGQGANNSRNKFGFWQASNDEKKSEPPEEENDPKFEK